MKEFKDKYLSSFSLFKKKNILILGISILILLVIVGLYKTYAVNTIATKSSIDNYDITITDNSSEVIVPADSSKTVIYQIKNTNKGTVRYGVGYEANPSVRVKVWYNSVDDASGLIEQYQYKYVKLKISNDTTSEQTVTLTSILGYENGGNLIVPSGITLVTEVYNVEHATFVISKLFSKTGTVTSNSISHDIDTTHQLIKDQAGNIRYYGTGISDTSTTYKEPDNYIDIGDNVLWRIIGVFNGKLKLIRSSSIGSYAWDSNNVNDWSTASLKTYLNSGDYYTSGITGTAKNRIAEVTWNLGGGWSTSIYPNAAYTMERGTTVYSGRPTTWTGNIALAYPSDYGYATDLSQCNQTLYDYDSSTKNFACRGNNWMWYVMTGATSASSNGPNYAWLLTPNSDSAHGAWDVDATGYVYDNGGVNYSIAVSPVIYLSSEQAIESGSGTSSDPYVLSA